MKKTGKNVTLMEFLHSKKEQEKDKEKEKNDDEVGVEIKVAVDDGERKEEKAPYIFTVQELTRYIKRRLDDDSVLRDVYVRGEISNLSQPTSGHLFFTIKDEVAELRCVMFRGKNKGLKFVLEDGMKVIARGYVSVYEKRGRYQLYVEEIEEVGIGALYLAFEQLKKKLQAEGLFDDVYKKPIPVFPRRIGIITSPTGAAISDMLNIIKRRFPHVHILLASVAVQGDDAPDQIVDAIRRMNRVSSNGKKRIDVMILGRGGGSIEELWAFNEEAVARAIFASEIPLISAVGHETDFTISDFVADKRAATPSEAAELVVPDKREIMENLVSMEMQVKKNVFKAIELQRKRLESIEKSIVFRKPTEWINQYRQTVDELKRKLRVGIFHRVEMHKKSLQALGGKLDVLSPLAILDRGYTICSRLDGRIIRSVGDIEVGDALRILLNDGEAISEVKEKEVKG